MSDLEVRPGPGVDVVVVAPAGTTLGSKVTYNASRTRVRVKNTGTYVEPTPTPTPTPVPTPPPPAFTADYHVSPTGNDSLDGRTKATAWKTLGKVQSSASVLARVALWDGGPIAGGWLDKPMHLTTAPGVMAEIKGAGKISLDIQRWTGGSVKPGEGGRITILQPGTPTEPTAADGEKAGVSLGRALSLLDCSDIDVWVYVKAGTDFGIYAMNVQNSKLWGDVTDAGEGFRLGGLMHGTTVDGNAHDNHRMVRNTKKLADGSKANDDYGAVGFSWVKSFGGRQLATSRAWNNYAKSFDYGWDGGAIEVYSVEDLTVDGLIARDCAGGFETGGDQGRPNRRVQMQNVMLTGDFDPGRPPGEASRNPVILIRNFEDSTFGGRIDATRARVAVEMYADSGSFGGSIERAVVRVTVTERPGVPIKSIRNLPTSAIAEVWVLQP